MIVPFGQLSRETLVSVIEDWLSRQSQDSVIDSNDRPALIEQVIEKLKENALYVTWDDESQTINIVSAESLNPAELQ